ncbi:MAG: hypothetical protein LBN04_01585 [Oscillospiraceae bacterium]|jgi:hypothetical protein|nr:hypothetical protein [Oscillospiraceae bacterium]
MAWYEWIFDGIGSSILSLVIGLLFGGAGGMAIERHRNKQKISIGDNAELRDVIQTNGGYHAPQRAAREGVVRHKRLSQRLKVGKRSSVKGDIIQASENVRK